MERALHDHGSCYNQDECTFCPRDFAPRFFICLQVVNTHRKRLLARMLVSTSRFSLSGFLRHGCKKISGDRRGVKLSIIPVLPTKSSA